MRKADWTVGENDVEPVGSRDACYCQAKVGEQHRENCVSRKRTVVVQATIEYVVAMPEHWTSDSIEFHRNESSMCANVVKRELAALFEHVDQRGCMCDRIETKYVREATAEDEEACGVRVEESMG
jgi:hypothetical protein